MPAARLVRPWIVGMDCSSLQEVEMPDTTSTSTPPEAGTTTLRAPGTCGHGSVTRLRDGGTTCRQRGSSASVTDALGGQVRALVVHPGQLADGPARGPHVACGDPAAAAAAPARSMVREHRLGDF